jgi:hypothetical protein
LILYHELIPPTLTKVVKESLDEGGQGKLRACTLDVDLSLALTTSRNVPNRSTESDLVVGKKLQTAFDPRRNDVSHQWFCEKKFEARIRFDWWQSAIFENLDRIQPSKYLETNHRIRKRCFDGLRQMAVWILRRYSQKFICGEESRALFFQLHLLELDCGVFDDFTHLAEHIPEFGVSMRGVYLRDQNQFKPLPAFSQTPSTLSGHALVVPHVTSVGRR